MTSLAPATAHSRLWRRWAPTGTTTSICRAWRRSTALVSGSEPVQDRGRPVPRIYERRRDLRVLDPDADFDAAAAYAAREGVDRRNRRVIEHEKAKPL